MRKNLGTKLGVLLLIIYFLFQCEIADAPIHEKMYFDAPVKEELFEEAVA